MNKRINNQLADENEVASRYLVRANNLSEWLWTIFFKYMKFWVSCLVATSLVSVLYCYLTRGNFNANHYYRPAKFEYVIEI